MDRRVEREVRQRLRAQKRRLTELMMALPEGASSVAEDCITAIVETDCLCNELEFLHDNSSESGESDAFVGAPSAPLPYLNSGEAALPEPDEIENK